MGINLNLNASESAGGSVNSARGASQSWSNTAGVAASAASAEQAKIAHERQLELLKKTQDFNAAEAQKARDWEERMANTIYTRSVENMKAAGINPILAAGMGLSGAAVGSGAAASTGTPSSFMGQTFAEQNSASSAANEAYGSSWNNSESGLATFLTQMGELVMGVASKIQNGMDIKFSLEGLDDILNGKDKGIPTPEKTIGKSATKTFRNTIDVLKNVVK